MIDTLVRIPDTEVATRFLQDQDTRAACFEWYWESYLQFHFRRIEAYLDVQGDPNWLARVRQCPEYEQHLLLTKGIQDAAITRFPRSGYLLKRVVLFWESHDRYLEAITYCRWAIEHGLTDDTKRGFPWRLRRIENKLRKMERHNQAVEASVASTPQPQR
jgi:hypothetical protein